jgi:hypothetical protein
VKNRRAIKRRDNFQVLQGAADGSTGDYRRVLQCHVVHFDGSLYQSLGAGTEELEMPTISEQDRMKVAIDIKSCGIGPLRRHWSAWSTVIFI